MVEHSNICTLNIYEKLMCIMKEIPVVVKNLEVQQTRDKTYKAVSERDILDAVKPLEHKYRVYSYPCKREILESHLIESSNTYQGKETKKTSFMSRMETVYRFVNIDDPKQYIETTVFSEGIDAQDKGSGKAMTYADKYALMKAYKISTGDDPDQTASKDEYYTDEYFDKIVKSKNLSAEQCTKIMAAANGDIDLIKDILGVFGYTSASETPAKLFPRILKEIEVRISGVASGAKQ